MAARSGPKRKALPPKKRQTRKRASKPAAKPAAKSLRKRAKAKGNAKAKTATRRAKASGTVEAALAAFAHEVRTPLTGILAISTLLATSELGERERRWVDTIKAGAEHLS